MEFLCKHAARTTRKNWHMISIYFLHQFCSTLMKCNSQSVQYSIKPTKDKKVFRWKYVIYSNSEKNKFLINRIWKLYRVNGSKKIMLRFTTINSYTARNKHSSKYCYFLIESCTSLEIPSINMHPKVGQYLLFIHNTKHDICIFTNNLLRLWYEHMLFESHDGGCYAVSCKYNGNCTTGNIYE